MKSTITFATVGLMLLALSGCRGDPYEDSAREHISIAKEYNHVLEGIKDAGDAKAAVPKLLALGKRLESLAKRGQELGEAPTEKHKALLEKYGIPTIVVAGAERRYSAESGG